MLSTGKMGIHTHRMSSGKGDRLEARKSHRI